MTKDRVVNVLGVLGAIFCLVAVLTGFGHVPQGDEDGSAPPSPTSQVGPVPGAPALAPVPGPAAPATPQDHDG